MEFEDGFISDESSFYGNDDDKQNFEELADQHAANFHSLNVYSLTAIALKNMEVEAKCKTETEPVKLFNPYEDYPSAWKLNERVDDFLARLPPSTATVAENSPWIWVANPVAKYRETDGHIRLYKEEGQEILERLEKKIDKVKREMHDKTNAAITRNIALHRSEAVAALENAARKHNVMTGKWMLFPDPVDVDRVWRVVVEGTLLDELGIGAKVATKAGLEELNAHRRPRLICVYTKDSTDKEDVKRVLKVLEWKGLAKYISYKCDSYTHLNIMKDNIWGIAPSIYQSKNMLRE